jgi:hypothetical protein
LALNANAPYTGAVQYFMQFDPPSDYAAPGVVVGGSYQVDARLRTAAGIGGQKVTRGGVIVARVEAELEEPLKAILSDMLRETPATTVTAKSFCFGNQDGEWTYADCQPGGFTATCGVGLEEGQRQTDRQSRFRVKAEFWAKIPGQTETGNTQEGVSGGITDNWSDFNVQVDSTDYACQRFELRLRTNPFVYSTLDSRAAGAKRLPVEVLLGTQEVELALYCAKQIPATASSLLADTVDNDLQVVIAGTSVTFTLGGLNTPIEEGPFQNANGLVVWRYRFTDNEWAALSIS